MIPGSVHHTKISISIGCDVSLMLNIEHKVSHLSCIAVALFVINLRCQNCQSRHFVSRGVRPNPVVNQVHLSPAYLVGVKYYVTITTVKLAIGCRWH